MSPHFVAAPPMTYEQIMLYVYNHLNTKPCDCCEGKGMHVQEATLEMFGLALEGVRVRSCTTCYGTGQLPCGPCMN